MNGTAVRRVADGRRALRVEDAVLADGPAEGWARLRTRAIGICGSDVHVLAGHHPFVRNPVYPGHELVVEVEDVGEGVDPACIGRRVDLEPAAAPHTVAVAIACVGVEAALRDAVTAVGKGGTVLVGGVLGRDAALRVGINLAFDNG